ARVLVGGQLLPAVVDQFLLGRRLPGPQTDVGLHGFSPVRVGNSDHRSFSNRRMAVEDVFDFPGPDLVPGSVDHVLLAVHDVEPALRVHEADVPGVQSTVANAGFGLLRVVPVLRDDHGALDDDLPGFADGEVLTVWPYAADARFEGRYPHAERPGGGVDRSFQMGRNGGPGGGRLA